MEIEVNGVKLMAAAASGAGWEKVIATVKPENIWFSKTADSDSEGASKNVVEGIVTEMAQMRSNVQVTVDAGFLLKTRLQLS